MKKNLSTKFIALWISAAALFTSGIVFACADYDFLEDFYNSFFAPETSHSTGFEPFYRSVRSLYGQDSYSVSYVNSVDTANTAEWSQFFNQRVSSRDLSFLLYTSSLGSIDTIIFHLKNANYPIAPELKNNTVFKIDDKALAREFLFYLGFAKRCEPYVAFEPNWYDGTTPITSEAASEMEKLYNKAMKNFANVKTPFIRQRYLFQFIRLKFQLADYEGCTELLTTYEKEIAQNNTIYFRILGYQAGAYYRAHDYSKANYLYSKIYDQCPSMRISAFRSFHPQEEKDWNDALQQAQTIHEKEVLWQLLGLYADPFRALQEIYGLNPKSELLPLLLTRLVNIQEERFISGQDFWREGIDSSYNLKADSLNSEVVAFILQVAEKENTNKPYLWNLSAGYFELVKRHFKKADQLLSKAQKEAKNDRLTAEQIRAFRLISTVEQYEKPSEKLENELAIELNWLETEKHDTALRSTSIRNWANRRLAEKYKGFNLPLKAHCLNCSVNASFYSNPDLMNQMYALMGKASKSAFERYILHVFPFKKVDLIESQAVELVYQYQFREAAAKFNEAGNDSFDTFLADPFVIHINDCHDCDQAAEKDHSYTKYSFTQRLIDLEKKARSTPKEAANDYFLMANGLYNITYFGNARQMYDTKVTGYFYDNPFWFYSDKRPSGPIYDCSKAEEYYKMAMYATTDKELKAKCCFMAAKCEQNRYYMSDQFTGDIMIVPGGGDYYKQLRFLYSKTKFYKEIIHECGYYRTYLAVNKN